MAILRDIKAGIQRIRTVVASLAIILCQSEFSIAACILPVENPSNAHWSLWADVLNAKAQKSLNKAISEVQDIETTGVGNVNLDFYSLTFNANGKSPEQWLTVFRKELDRYIYKDTSYSVGAFDDESERLWNSDRPLGAILVFNLSQLLGVPFERGAVVVSCVDSTSFIFSTVSIHGTLNPGDHPVSGNRGFGFVKNLDGSINFFTKAADRLKGNNNTFKAIGSERTFSLGAEVWNRLLDNLMNEMAAWKPRNRVAYRRVEPYPNPLSAPTNLQVR